MIENQKHSSSGSSESPLNALDSRVAGRDLDAVIAQRVFDYPRSQGWTGKLLFWNGEPCWTNASGFPATCPRYSTDIAAAMSVIDAVLPRIPDNRVIKNLGFAQVRIYRYGDDTWNVAFTKRGGSPSATAESLPEAICRAALAAVGQHSTEQSAKRLK